MGPVVVFRPTSSKASAVFAWVVALVLLVAFPLANVREATLLGGSLALLVVVLRTQQVRRRRPRGSIRG